jgi:hypothetical protein
VILMFFMGNDVRKNSPELDPPTSELPKQRFHLTDNGELRIDPPDQERDRFRAAARRVVQQIVNSSALATTIKSGVLDQFRLVPARSSDQRQMPIDYHVFERD